MPRPLRIQYAGARYHVMSRGDRREAVFYDDTDRMEFLRTLSQACLKTGWQVHSQSCVRQTPMSRQWIADRLRMGSASYVSNLLCSVDSKL